MSIYHPVAQGSDEWHALRSSRINSSEMAELIGLSKYKSPIQAIKEKIIKTSGVSSSIPEEHPAKKFFEHGHKYERLTFLKFIEWMEKEWPEFYQQYTLPSGYHTPAPANPNFPDPDDVNRFGVSLDGEGSEYDAEFKNPYTYLSLLKNYIEDISIEHFIQCQTAMAMRQRTTMFYVATHFDPETTLYLGLVVWRIKFSPFFFNTYIYLKAVKAYQMLHNGIDDQDAASKELPWMNMDSRYSISEEWEHLKASTCEQLHVYKNGKLISELIKKRTGR